jgi:hypothetical protein
MDEMRIGPVSEAGSAPLPDDAAASWAAFWKRDEPDVDVADVVSKTRKRLATESTKPAKSGKSKRSKRDRRLQGFVDAATFRRLQRIRGGKT